MKQEKIAKQIEAIDKFFEGPGYNKNAINAFMNAWTTINRELQEELGENFEGINIASMRHAMDKFADVWVN